MEPITTAVAVAGTTIAVGELLISAVKDLLSFKKDVTDMTRISLPAYTKAARIVSRVYIDANVALDPVVTDVLKTVHTQYAAFVLAAFQMNHFVTAGRQVSDLLKVVATEDHQPHRSVLEAFGVDSDRLTSDDGMDQPKPADVQRQENDLATREQKERDLKLKHKFGVGGEIVSFAGDNHIPAGKLLQIKLTNPDPPGNSIDITLMVVLSPYIVPAPIATAFIVKDVVPSFAQRVMQWKTGEIGFWNDLIGMSDIINNRAKLLKLDTTGVLAEMLGAQQTARVRVMGGLNEDKATRSRNIANAVLIFSAETLMRAKVESGIDLNDAAARQRYFAHTFAMMIVVVDQLYNQVTIYYNGLSDYATYTFDQMRIGSKGGSSLDLVSVMNALSQGKPPRF